MLIDINMTSATIRLEEQLKQDAQKIAKAMGVSFNDLVRMLLGKTIRERGVDLRRSDLTVNGFTPEYEQSILEADRAGGYKAFNSVDDMIECAKKENDER